MGAALFPRRKFVDKGQVSFGSSSVIETSRAGTRSLEVAGFDGRTNGRNPTSGSKEQDVLAGKVVFERIQLFLYGETTTQHLRDFKGCGAAVGQPRVVVRLFNQEFEPGVFRIRWTRNGQKDRLGIFVRAKLHVLAWDRKFLGGFRWDFEVNHHTFLREVSHLGVFDRRTAPNWIRSPSHKEATVAAARCANSMITGSGGKCRRD